LLQASSSPSTSPSTTSTSPALQAATDASAAFKTNLKRIRQKRGRNTMKLSPAPHFRMEHIHLTNSAMEWVS